MSYDAETARQKLTGEAFDECILNEREQRHGLLEYGGHILPQEEFEELVNALHKRMPRFDERFLKRWSERNFTVTEPGEFLGWLCVPSMEYIALRDSYIATLPKEDDDEL